MNVKEIKQIMQLVNEYSIAELEIEREGSKLSLKKYSDRSRLVQPSEPIQAISHSPIHLPPSSSTVVSKPPKKEEEIESDNTIPIFSPMVGTFYASPSPESASFVSVGSKIKLEDTICIIEAMKVMNELKAEIAGEIVEVCVANGQVVEFGQTLFKVKK